MSVTTVLLRWLTARLAIGANALHRPATAKLDEREGALGHPTVRPPLRWRTPWRSVQFLSLSLSTLLAPTFWVIGILLMIDSHSDHPFFWPSLMAIVAIGNIVAIVAANQRHHRHPFPARLPLALYYFRVSTLTGCLLFLLVGLRTGALQDFVGPMSASLPETSPIMATTLWSPAIAAGFALLSFTHASVLHAWFAFEAPLPQRRIKR
jgi:hypothetical protein